MNLDKNIGDNDDDRDSDGSDDDSDGSDDDSDGSDDDFKSIKIIDSKVPSKVKEWPSKSSGHPHPIYLQRRRSKKIGKNIFQNFDKFFIFIYSEVHFSLLLG